MRLYRILKLGLVATLLHGVLIVCASADVLMPGSQHIGDQDWNAFTPSEPVTRAEEQANPSHFSLSEPLTITSVTMQNAIAQFRGSIQMDLFVDGRKVGTSNTSDTFTLNSPLNLTAGVHTLYIDPYCIDRRNQNTTNCTGATSEADLGFSGLVLNSADSSDNVSFNRRYHIGDSTLGNDYYAGRVYPDAPDTNQLSLDFSVASDSTLSGLTLYHVRDVSSGCAEPNNIYLDKTNNKSIIGEINQNGTLSISTNVAVKAGSHTLILESGLCTGRGRNADLDDVSWDDIILDLEPANALGGFSIAVGTSNASTCAPLSVTVSALKKNGTVDKNYNKQIELSTSSGHGDWALVAGNGVFDNGVADDGIAYYTFAKGGGGDNGVAQFELTNTHADDLTISAVEVGKASTLSTTGTITFRDNAFVVSDVDSLPGDNIAVVGRPHAYKVEMIDKDSSTGRCRADPHYSGNIALKTWLTRDGLDPGGAAPTIGGTALPNAQPGANNLNLSFSAGTASFSLATTDVGKYGLNFRDDSSPFALDSSNNPRPIVGGTTTELTVRPFGFRVSGAPLYSSPSSASSTVAGSAFSATITAVAWQAGDDSNDDGKPDGHADSDPSNDADLSDNAVTPSYAWSTALGTAQPYAPTGGTQGTLSGFTSLGAGAFAGGQANVSNLTYSEVGAFTLSLKANGYLGTTGADAASISPRLGRFRPARFVFTTLSNACSSATTPFTYASQPLGQILVTAENQGGATTQNYTGSFAKSANFSSSSPGVSVISNASLTAGDFTQGQANIGSPNTPALGFSNAETAPLDAADLTLTDSDGVTGSGNLRLLSGRLAVDNAVGSEQLPLQLPVRVEYYSGGNNGWTVNSDDSCTTAADLTPNLTSNAVGTSVSSKSLTNGSGNVTLSAPGTVGYADLELQGPDWLKFIWSPSGSPTNPTARASFGLYKSNEHSIYVQ